MQELCTTCGNAECDMTKCAGWRVRTTFKSPQDAAWYVDQLDYSGGYSVSRREDGLYALKLL